MSEHHYPAPHPDESPQGHEAREPETPTFITPDEVEQAKAARYRQEAIRLYFANAESESNQVAWELTPFTEPRLAFETAYEGTFEGRMAFVEHVAIELGWFRIIHRVATQMGVPVGTLRIDYAAAYDYFARYFRIVRTPEDVLHVFTRPGIKPMAPDITVRGGSAS